jgi:hypothetical protein
MVLGILSPAFAPTSALAAVVGERHATTASEDCDDKSAILQQLSGERKMFDRNNLVVQPDSLYQNMKEFRLAMRQYTIDKEFELGIEATNTMRYICYCSGGDSPWSINARVEHKG